MDGEPTETPQKIKTVEKPNFEQSDSVNEKLEAQPPDEYQHQESYFRDEPETELAA